MRYMFVKSTKDGVWMSCGSVEWANLFEIHTRRVEYLQNVNEESEKLSLFSAQ